MKNFPVILCVLLVAVLVSDVDARRQRRNRKSGGCASGNCAKLDVQVDVPGVKVDVSEGEVNVEVQAGKATCCKDLSCSKCVVETQTLVLINGHRQRAGLRAFKRDAGIITGCRRHCVRQTRRGMHHARNLEGCRGECVAAGQQTPSQVVNSWMNSRGHRAILMGNGRSCGVSVVAAKWTLRTR